MSNRSIDLNCDLGEGYAFDEQIMAYISSANIACGAHAGDPVTLRNTIRFALKHDVAVGAHPGLWDSKNFGRHPQAMTPEDAKTLVQYQLGAIRQIANAEGATLNHLKLHGALYHMANQSMELADAVIQATTDIDDSLVIFGPPHGQLLVKAKEYGLRVAAEAFADRRYDGNGNLVNREVAGAEITDIGDALQQAIDIVVDGKVSAIEGNTIVLAADTLCLHGDNAKALIFAEKINQQLQEQEVVISSP